MNANEVIANRAIELLGGKMGSKSPVHPNDHVNKSQSSNDVIPTVIHVAATLAIRDDLLPALEHLHEELVQKARAFDHIVKTGRTHLQDATPIRLGQEFGGYAAQVEKGVERAEKAMDAATPIDDVRASAAYRKAMVRNLTLRGLRDVWKRLREP